jgi:hypothetical protein
VGIPTASVLPAEAADVAKHLGKRRNHTMHPFASLFEFS